MMDGSDRVAAVITNTEISNDVNDEGLKSLLSRCLLKFFRKAISLLMLQHLMGGTDLKSSRYLGHPLVSNSQRMAHVQRTLCRFTAHGLSAEARIQQMHPSVSRQLQSPALQVLRSVSVHGLCAPDRSGEPAGHLYLLAGDAAQAVSCRNSMSGFKEHPGRCQREPGLAHLRRVRSSAH